LDVRTTQEYQLWKLSYDKIDTPKLIPVDKLIANYSELLPQIPKNKEIVTVCAHGNRSMMAANILGKLGYSVKSLSGGMAGWNKVYDVAEVPVPDQSPFRIWQIRRISKGCMGYLISSVEEKTAIAIDPSLEIYESFLKVAEENGIQITRVIDTHQHADHVSGVIKLVNTINAKQSLHSAACFSSLEEYDDNNEVGIETIQWLADGDHVKIGKEISVKAIHTPGHTSGSMSFYLENNYNGSQNIKQDGQEKNSISRNYLFTGDTLFVDGIGRPDLRDEARNFAGVLYDTFQDKIKTLPFDTVILPAHFNGSSVTLKHAVPVFGTIEPLMKKIKPLSINKEEFINFIAETLPPRPLNYKMIISINKKMLPYDRMQIPDLESGPNSCAISS